MPTIATTAPASTTGRKCDKAPIAMIGSPTAVIIGHQEPPGTWIGAGGRSGNGAIGPWRSVCQSGSRFATVGMTVKLYTGGGDGIAHSSVAPFHGLAGAFTGCHRVRSRFQKKISVAMPTRNAPMVETRLKPATPRSGE